MDRFIQENGQVVNQEVKNKLDGFSSNMMAEIPGFGGFSDQVQIVPSQMFGNPSPVFRRPNGAL